MAVPFLALLAATAPSVGLYVAGTEGVNADDRSYLIAAFAASLERETGQVPVMDAFAKSPEELRARADVSSVVTVQMFTGSQLARIAVEYQPRDADPKTLQLDLPRDRESWAPTLDGVARVLFPLVVAPRAPEPLTPPERSTAIGWAGVGSGAAIIATGIALRVVAERHRREAERYLDDGVAPNAMALDAAMDAQDRNASYGLASNLSILVGAILSTAGAVYLGVAE